MADPAIPQPPSAAPVVLHQFPRIWGRNASPFTLKLETWLRLAHIPYRTVETLRFADAPYGKKPFITDAGQTIGDSTLVIEHLKRTRHVDPDATLSPLQVAESTALQRLFENHFYFVGAYSRWLDPDGWDATREGFFRSLPAWQRGIACGVAQRRVRATLMAQGIARHDRSEIYAMGEKDLVTIAEFLAGRSFFMGDTPSTIDAVAYGFLANLYLVPVETGLKRIAERFTSLKIWTEVMDQGLKDLAPGEK